MPGNPGFLLGRHFSRGPAWTSCGLALIALDGQAVLLCITNDAECGRPAPGFGPGVHNPAYQAQFLSQPLAAHKQFIAGGAHETEAKADKQADMWT